MAKEFLQKDPQNQRGLSTEAIEALCDEYELQRLSKTNTHITADIKCDDTEVVRVDYLNENDELTSRSVVIYENSPRTKKIRR